MIKDVKGKGKEGEIIEGASGFANHLIRNKQAVLCTDDNLKELKKKNDIENQKALALLEEMKKLKVFLEENPVTMQVKVNKEGKLFGHITSKQVVDEIKNKFNIVLDKRKFLNFEDISALGTYNLEIALHKDVKGQVIVHVVEKKA